MMSSNENINEPKLNQEAPIQDFGSSELNEIYKNLDINTKDEVDKIKNEKNKIAVLKNIADP